jgi:hypothetical protein
MSSDEIYTADTSQEAVQETTQQYSTVQGLELLRFRAWLETETNVNGKPVIDQFPITNLAINASLNSIPTATVNVAVGFDMATCELGTIHTPAARNVLQPFTYTYAKIYFRNLSLSVEDATADGAVIFEGYINSSSESYSKAGTTVSLTMVHWAYGLDASPACNTRINPLSASDFTSALYQAHDKQSTGDGGQQSAKTVTIHDLWGPIKNAEGSGATAIVADMIGYGLLIVLRTLYKWGTATHLHSIVPRLASEQFDIGLRIGVEEILLERVKTGDAVAPGAGSMPRGYFPILALNKEVTGSTSEGNQSTNSDVSNSIQSAIGRNFFHQESTDLVMNSLWATMVAKAGMFGFMIVPRVHELRFIPKWYMARITDPIELNPIVIQAVSTHPRPIKAVVTMSSKTKGDTTGSSGGLSQSLHEYGWYINPVVDTGTLLVRNRPDWASDIPFIPLVNTVPDPAVAAPVNQQSTVTNSQVPQADTLYRRLAEEAYWDTMFEGGQLVAVGPLRFDICPGSTVKVWAFQNPIAPSLSSSYLGLVTTLKFTLDVEQATATTQYTLTHVRPEDNKLNSDQASLIHPIFDCRPFTGANWTEGDVATSMAEEDFINMNRGNSPDEVAT